MHAKKPRPRTPRTPATRSQGLTTCPACGRLLSIRFPLHDCDPPRNILDESRPERHSPGVPRGHPSH